MLWRALSESRPTCAGLRRTTRVADAALGRPCEAEPSSGHRTCNRSNHGPEVSHNDKLDDSHDHSTTRRFVPCAVSVVGLKGMEGGGSKTPLRRSRSAVLVKHLQV